ncbi:MAG: family 16 glycoside hydrolase [Limisphaerales bacterium]
MAWNKLKIGLLVTCIALVVAGVLLSPIFFVRPVKGIPKGWSVISGNPDQWTWSEGKIKGETQDGESILASGKEYRDVSISAVALSTNREASFVIRAKDAQHGYLVAFVPSNTSWLQDTGWIELVRREPNKDVTLASYRGRGMAGSGHSAKIDITANGPWIEVRLNGVTVIRTKDMTYSKGFIGLRIFGRGNHPCNASYSHLNFR